MLYYILLQRAVEKMKNKNGKFIIYLSLILIEILVITFLMEFYLDDFTQLDFLMFSMLFVLVIVSVATSLVSGLFLGAFIVIVYGSYILYSKMAGIYVSDAVYVWIVLLPVTAFLGGHLGEEIRFSHKSLEKCMDKDELITIDKQSGLGNIKDFYGDLADEIARARRHKFPLTLMIVEISYFDELRTIYASDDISKIIKTMSNIIKDSLRREDKQFRIEDDRFSVVMPHTGVEGAEVVKKRIKEMLKTIVLTKSDSIEQLKFEIKIGLKEYDEDVKNQFHYKELVVKELEYDV